MDTAIYLKQKNREAPFEDGTYVCACACKRLTYSNLTISCGQAAANCAEMRYVGNKWWFCNCAQISQSSLKCKLRQNNSSHLLSIKNEMIRGTGTLQWHPMSVRGVGRGAWLDRTTSASPSFPAREARFVRAGGQGEQFSQWHTFQ